MKTARDWALGLMALGWAASVHAQDFSHRLRPEEFAAAGLAKLTAGERAQLDALVRAHARDESERVRAATEAQVRADTAVVEPAPAPSLVERTRVVLTPGTEIAYESVETQIAGNFRGYEPGKVLTLANGQRWRVVDGAFWAPARDADKPRRVVIEPGALGSFFLDIENGGRPKVKFVGLAK